MSTLPNPSPAVIHLRAAIAYAETRNKGDAPFTLIPYADAIAAGVPFAETLVHEGNDWAVFVMGDASPEDLEYLEQAGVIDADDARQEVTGGFDYPRHVEELEAGIPAAVAALESAFSAPSTCAAETFEETLSAFVDKAKKDGNEESLRQLVATLHSLLPSLPLLLYILTSIISPL